MEIFKLISIAIICAIIILYLKNTNPEIAFIATIATGIIMLLLIINMLGDVFTFFKTISDKSNINSELIKLILKIIGVAYLVEFTAGLIEDFGNKSLADKLVFAGKIIILVLSLPILNSLLTIILTILE